MNWLVLVRVFSDHVGLAFGGVEVLADQGERTTKCQRNKGLRKIDYEGYMLVVVGSIGDIAMSLGHFDGYCRKSAFYAGCAGPDKWSATLSAEPSRNMGKL